MFQVAAKVGWKQDQGLWSEQQQQCLDGKLRDFF